MEKIEEFKMTVFDSYTTEQLQRLYKSYTLYITTNYFKKCLKNVGYLKCMTYNQFEKDWARDSLHLRYLNRINAYTNDQKINNELYKSENERINLMQEKVALIACNESLFWFDGGIERLKEDYENGCCVKNPTDVIKELHENDDINNSNGHPTDEEIYEFIWETLRFCDIEELTKLLRFADKKFTYVTPGRPINNWKIIKYDLNGNFIEQYDNRAECMEKNNIKKSRLSELLSGKRLSYKGFKYIEKRLNTV